MLNLEAIGFLGKDAEKKTLQSGKTVINFSIAHTERYKDSKGDSVEKTTWVECAYWTEKDGILKYLVKGKQVYITGTPEVRTWEANGKHGASISVRIRDVQLLGGATEARSTEQPVPQNNQAPVKQMNNTTTEEDISNLPF
jgi:single-strand DNA-binding protein